MNQFDRRLFMCAVGGCLAVPHLASAQKKPILKTIPSTGEQIPAIGMGSWLTFDVGKNKSLRSERTKVLRTFFEHGGKLVDSSPMYGSSQEVIGHALGKINPGSKLFSADKVWINNSSKGKQQIRRSANRWNVDQFDLLQVHNLVSWEAHLETLFEMKEARKLRYVGITSYSGIRYDDIEHIMKNHPIDFIQITYNIIDREAEIRLLPLAREKGIAVIANRPFREGPLINAVKRSPLPDLAKEIGAQNWAQYLLKFIISHPALTVAIPATRRVDHMIENMGALRGPLPDAKMRLKMALSV